MEPIPIMRFKHAIFLLLLLLLLHTAAADRSVRSRRHRSILTEKAALLAFKSRITPDPQAALANWIESNDVCNFTGIQCNRWRLHVVQLQLKRKSIQGSLSPLLANLTGLRVLDLSENELTGRIPPELSSLRHLQDLELSGNQLSGPIPESFSLLASLTFLSLGGNHLVGSIPASILANCTYLGVLDLSDNELSGKIPLEIGNNLPYLYGLNLYLNNLTGEIPLSLSNSSLLNLLDVENNYLSGELPSEVVYKLKRLQILHLSYNDLRSHGNNSDLRPFFSALSNCSSLTELEMVENGLGGRLPRAVGRLTRRLSIINMEDNRIRGSIPPDIANLCNLTLLNLSSNLLEGTIPEEIGQLPRLERLILSSNMLRGAIPESMGNISSLGLLDLSKNRLSGEIPVSLGNLTRIIELLLQKNRLSGAIPSSLGRSRDLNNLDLSYNRLTGEIPQEVAGVARIYLNLSNNRLHGPLPVELSKMEQVQEIDLSSNNLTGEVIPQLLSCIAVKLINLSHNSLRGPLPGSFGDLKNLECLDVSFNSLSGAIPVSLYKCTSLTHLNLSFNDLSGSIPTGGIFSFFTNLSFLGNPHLCGSLSGPVCSQRSSSLHSRRFLVSACVIASVLAFVLTVFCVIGFTKLKGVFLTNGNATAPGSAPAMKSSYPRITYRELAEATGDFDQGNLLGSGGYGHVYRGVLNDGTNVAVKVLNLQTGNSTKSFTRECQVLKRIRHRNLMRIITACSLPDFKALVLPFMANGSLEGHLYPSTSAGGLPSSRLDLIQRVSICSDVAEGMAYLHHHSPVRVIHCDLKPSNVLLNDDMTALVSDFGISRLAMTVGGGGVVAADNVGNSSSVNMLCGSIGYIAPEYGFGSRASTKGDVYSFGVLVLEMVTGRRPTEEMFEGGMSLHRWVRSSYPGSVERVVDASIKSAARDQTDEVKKMWEVALDELLELGLLCTQENPSLRPTMLDAADDLDRLKRYLAGDTTVTFVSSFGLSSSTFGED